MILTLHQTYSNINFRARKPKIPVNIQEELLPKTKLEKYMREGKSYKEIGEIVSKPAYWVRYQAINLNVKSQPQRTREKLEKVIPAYIERGLTMKEMSEKTGIDASTIAKYIKKHHDKKPIDVRREIAENLFKQNLSDREIALRLDLDTASVNDMRHRYGFTQEAVKEQKIERRKSEITEKLQKGLSLDKIAEELKLSKKTITNFMKEHMEIENVGEYLKNIKAAIAREQYSKGVPAKEIAKKLQITENAVKKLLNQ